MESGISPVLKTEGFTEDELAVMTSPDKIGVFVCNINGIKTRQLVSMCHSPVRGGQTQKITGMITNFTGNHEGADNLLKFLFWKKGIFQDLMKIAPEKWVLLMKDGKCLGICIPDEVMAFKPYALVYAFLICTRMCTEAKPQMLSFKKMVELGHNPTLAFVACQWLSVEGGQIICRGNGAVGWSGGHQAFVDRKRYDYDADSCLFMDYKKLLEGRYKTDLGDIANRCSRLFFMDSAKDGAMPMSAFVWSAYTQTIKTRFSTITSITEENLAKALADFEKFLLGRYKDPVVIAKKTLARVKKEKEAKGAYLEVLAGENKKRPRKKVA